MAERTRQIGSHGQELELTSEDIERRKRIAGLDANDLSRIRSVQELVTRNAEGFTTAFFNHLAGLEEARELVTNRQLADQVRYMKREHLVAMVKGEYGAEYMQQRIALGALYGKAGLEARVFLAAFHQLLRAIGGAIVRQYEHAPTEGFEIFTSIQKVAFIDVGLIVDALMFERERTIHRQQDAIRELSTPVLQIRDRLLLLPIIGVIDTHRARLVTETLLRSIRDNRAKVVVMDVTGVATIDSKVANHLLQTVSAARLMGALVIVTGLSADVAQSLVALGIELAKITTVGDLQGGLEEAERILGYQVRISGETAGIALS